MTIGGNSTAYILENIAVLKTQGVLLRGAESVASENLENIELCFLWYTPPL